MALRFNPIPFDPGPSGSDYATQWGKGLNDLSETYVNNQKQKRQDQLSELLFGIKASEAGYDPNSLIGRHRDFMNGSRKGGPAPSPIFQRTPEYLAQQDRTRQKETVEIDKLRSDAEWNRRRGTVDGGGTTSPINVPKQLPPASVLSVNDGETVARMLPEVAQTIDQNAALFGPVLGRIGANNPYNTDAQAVEARMRSASQTFGRFMEGGVLRKEDEDKYRRMFPQLSDTPDVAKKKLAIVQDILQKQSQSQIQSLGNSGYDVSGFQRQQPSGMEDPLGLR